MTATIEVSNDGLTYSTGENSPIVVNAVAQLPITIDLTDTRLKYIRLALVDTATDVTIFTGTLTWFFQR